LTLLFRDGLLLHEIADIHLRNEVFFGATGIILRSASGCTFAVLNETDEFIAMMSVGRNSCVGGLFLRILETSRVFKSK
jgi:hypothetical protein